MMQEALHDAQKYQAYREHLAANGVSVQQEEPLQLIHKGNGELLFGLLRLQAQADTGEVLPPIVLLRGHFVSVLTCLIAEETGNRYLVLVKQRRIATGGYFYEHPAGMVDNHRSISAVAAAELSEETGLVADPYELYMLRNEPLYTSPGLLDEGGYFFALEREMPYDDILALDSQLTGAADDAHEHIQLKIVRFGEAWTLLNNANAVLHLYLYMDYQNIDRYGRDRR
jgi:8-oxo-dGTP pyrophosphatase MutT (NUDIX family)